MRDCRVVRFSPSQTAAPFVPPTIPLVSFSTCRMGALSSASETIQSPAVRRQTGEPAIKLRPDNINLWPTAQKHRPLVGILSIVPFQAPRLFPYEVASEQQVSPRRCRKGDRAVGRRPADSTGLPGACSRRPWLSGPDWLRRQFGRRGGWSDSRPPAQIPAPERQEQRAALGRPRFDVSIKRIRMMSSR